MKIAVIGLGYVGIPLMISVVNSGHTVLGYDINTKVIEKLNDKNCHLNLWKDKVNRVIEPGKNVEFSASPEILTDAEVVIVCVPTPLSLGNLPDHSYVDHAFEEISNFFKGDLVILESTVSPGYTRNAGQQYLGERLLLNGGNVSLCFSPEREDPGNEKFTNVEIPKVIGGLTQECLERGVRLYMKIFQHVAQATSVEAAEFCKVHENTFRAINITYVNQVRNLSEKLSVDFEEVVNLAKTKPFGFMPFTSGVGVGGHCIPVDPYFMLRVAEKYDVKFSTFEAAMEEISVSAVNTANWLSENIESDKILITGAAYKDDVSDTRCSPSLELLAILSDKYKVAYWDANVPEVDINGRKVQSINDQQFIEFDGAVVIVNDAGKKFVNLNKLNAKVIIDARYRKQLNS